MMDFHAGGEPRDWSGHDLANDPLAVWAVKRPVRVFALFAVADGTLETLEGSVRYRKGDALLTGPRRERWPVARERFLERYQPANGGQAISDGFYVSKPRRVRARRMVKEFVVKVGHAGDLLQGQPGDWLLQYSPEEWGVVAAAIFDETYDVSPPAAPTS